MCPNSGQIRKKEVINKELQLLNFVHCYKNYYEWQKSLIPYLVTTAALGACQASLNRRINFEMKICGQNCF